MRGLKNMIFSRFFSPKHKDQDPNIRLEAIAKLNLAKPADKEALHELAFNDDSAKVSIAALDKLNTFALWQKMAEIAADSDVVISTAAIPGRQSPLLITAEALQGMSPGSVVVDLAAERGGNCELSQPDQRVVEHGVVILGPTNLPAEVAFHASQMYSNNVTKFLLNMVHEGNVELNLEDEIVRDTLVAHAGDVTSPRIRELLDLPELPAETPTATETGDEAATDQPSEG